ncbi:Hypothetical protein POVR1_LOCUS293 [uncultured virus]|nr:Hypothetical protein POVR1_LOCUS293 [uncultured virus]
MDDYEEICDTINGTELLCYDDEAELLDPICEACTNNDLESLRSLLENFDPSVNKNQAIGIAAGYGYIEILQALIQDSRITPNDHEDYALRNAVHGNHLEAVKLLLTCDVNPTSSLEIASDLEHHEVLELLIRDPRCDPYIRHKFATKFSISYAQTQNIELFRGAVENNDADLVEELINFVVPEDSLLIVAIQNENIRIVKLLLSREEIDPSQQDNLPVTLAQDINNSTILRLLLESERLLTSGLSRSHQAIRRAKWVYLDVFNNDDLLRNILSYTPIHLIITKRIEAMSRSNQMWKLRFERAFGKAEPANNYQSLFYQGFKQLSKNLLRSLVEAIFKRDIPKVQQCLLDFDDGLTPVVINFTQMLQLVLNPPNPDIFPMLLRHRNCRLGTLVYFSTRIEFGSDSKSNGIWEQSPRQVQQIFDLACAHRDRVIILLIFQHYPHLVKIDDCSWAIYAQITGDCQLLAKHLKSLDPFPDPQEIYRNAKSAGNFELAYVYLEDPRFILNNLSEHLEVAISSGNNQDAVNFLTICMDLGKYEREIEIRKNRYLQKTIKQNAISTEQLQIFEMPLSAKDQETTIEIRPSINCDKCGAFCHQYACPLVPQPLRFHLENDLSGEDLGYRDIFREPESTRLQKFQSVLSEELPMKSPSRILNCILSSRLENPDLCYQMIKEFLKRPLVNFDLSEIFQVLTINHATEELKLLTRASGTLIIPDQLLVDAIIIEDDSMVEILLPYTFATYSDNLPLREACRTGNVKIIQRLLSDPRVDPSFDDNFALSAILLLDIPVTSRRRIAQLLLRDPRVIPTYQHYLHSEQRYDEDLTRLIIEHPRFRLPEGIKFREGLADFYEDRPWTLERVELLETDDLVKALMKYGNLKESHANNLLGNKKLLLMSYLSQRLELDELSDKIYQSSSFEILYELPRKTWWNPGKIFPKRSVADCSKLTLSQHLNQPLKYEHRTITPLAKILLVCGQRAGATNNIFNQYVKELLPLFAAIRNDLDV